MYYVNHEIIKEKNPIIIDCRYDMAAPEQGLKSYRQAHFPGAFYMGLESDMTDEVKEHGGRHPLKSLDVFLKKIKSLGIEKNSSVLIYDDGSLAMASRLWFMLKLIGLKNVYILKGGYKALVNAGYKMTDELPKEGHSQLEMDFQSHLLSSLEEVKAAQRSKKAVIVDARARNRYLGLEEPIDFVAGHIPESVNYFWQDTLEEDFIPEEHFKALKAYETIINHCGSGVTGCVNMFFQKEANMDSKLYLGSFSDWISYGDHEIVVKDNKILKVSQVTYEKN